MHFSYAHFEIPLFFTKNNLVNAHVVFLSHCTSDLLANAIMLQFLKRWGKETSSFLR